MTWSYTGIPSSSSKDEVRFWTQDVNPQRPLLSDEEIGYLIDNWLEQTGSIVYVSAIACEVIAAKFAPETSVSADGVSVSTGELQQKYITLAQRLRDTAALEGTDEISFDMDDVWGTAIDEALEPLVFGIGFMDNWEVGRADYGNYHPGRYQNSTVPDELAPDPIEGTEAG